MYYTLSQAAKETGKSKSVISKALKTGKISYQEKNSSGYKIEASELFRVFPRTLSTNEKEQLRTRQNQLNHDESNEALKVKLELTEKRFSDAEKTILHLQTLLDEERKERRRLFERLLPPPKQKNSLLHRLLNMNKQEK